MDIEILDTLPVIAKLRPDLCEREGDIYKLKFPDGSTPLEIDVSDEDREDHERDFAIVTGWAFQVLQNGLGSSQAEIHVDVENDDGMGIFQVYASYRGIGRIGESEIFEYAVLECLKQSLEPNAFRLGK